MDEYTPPTGWIRIMVGWAKRTATDRTLPPDEAMREGYEWFDRWLAAHDREVLHAAAAVIEEDAETCGRPQCHRADAAVLRFRADRGQR